MTINPQFVNFLLAGSVVLFLTPYLILSLLDLKKVERKISTTPRFFRDVVDNVDSGADLISAFRNAIKNEYGVLNEDVKKLSNQLSWGVPFDKAFMDFAENVGEKNLKRDIKLVIEARRVGGHAEQILRELSEKISTETVRIKQRRSNLASNTFTGYISFIIFLVIVVVVYNNLFLELGSSFGGGGEGDVSGVDTQQFESMIDTYITLITLLSYELAILSGLLFGQMQDNRVISGTPHVVVLVAITFIALFFFL